MKHIWHSDQWKKHINPNDSTIQRGFHLHFEKGVDESVRIFCRSFAKWLRTEFRFPLRLNVYIKSDYRIKAKDGEAVVGTMWRPEDYDFLKNGYPYIRLAVGDYCELVEERGEEQAMWAILATFAHELTHYYQYINDLPLTEIGEERQASAYVNRILQAYDAYLGEITGDMT